MRLFVVGALVSAGLLFAVLAGRSASQVVAGPALPAAVHAPAQSGRGSDLITHFADGNGQQVLTVVDPRQEWIGVYHIDGKTGELTLKSARRYTWDLQLTYFNNGKPLPEDVRNGLPR
jgi:hypothetical protein